MWQPPSRACILLNTSGVAHYVITHDLVNLTIFCYDYKMCLSTIITFEKQILHYIIYNITSDWPIYLRFLF